MTPFTFSAFLAPGRPLHFFGPAVGALLDRFLRQATEDGWVVAKWAGVSDPFPEAEEDQKTIVVVRVRAKDWLAWSLLIPNLSLLGKRSTLLVGVSEEEAIPTAWKFYAGARFRADSPMSFSVVKDTISWALQGCSFILEDDGTWSYAPLKDEGDEAPECSELESQG